MLFSAAIGNTVFVDISYRTVVKILTFRYGPIAKYCAKSSYTLLSLYAFFQEITTINGENDKPTKENLQYSVVF